MPKTTRSGLAPSPERQQGSSNPLGDSGKASRKQAQEHIGEQKRKGGDQVAPDRVR